MQWRVDEYLNLIILRDELPLRAAIIGNY